VIFAVISLTALLLTVALAARKTRPVAPSAANVISLDAYRAARRGGRRHVLTPADTAFQYPLTAAGGGLPTAPSGGLRTCRLPDGRLGRPSARTEPA